VINVQLTVRQKRILDKWLEQNDSTQNGKNIMFAKDLPKTIYGQLMKIKDHEMLDILIERHLRDHVIRHTDLAPSICR
jgi:hypothetical protein